MVYEIGTEEQTKSTEVRDYKETVAFWQRELQSSKDRLKPWHKQATKIVQRFLDDRPVDDELSDHGDFHLNLFHSNTKTLESLLYGNLPKAQVARRHLDANDDAARVAATLKERLLNTDLQENGKERDAVLRAILQDRLLSGLGVARVRYTFKSERIEVVAEQVLDDGAVIPAEYAEVTVDEQAPIEYVYWNDVLWGWARSWAELPWIAYRAYLSKDEVGERFPGYEEKVKYIQQPAGDEKGDTDSDEDSPHHKAEIWEIWDRASKCVYWVHTACSEILDKKKDPLGVSGFFPSPPFLIANPTTMLYKPKPDFVIYQDLYNEIDEVQSRLSILKDAVKVVGVYDANQKELARMLKEGFENDMIPVDSWAMFAEKGGLKGTMDWFPVDAVVNAIIRLREYRDDCIALLQRTTGMADVLSGQVNQYEGVGQSELKVAYGSARVQSLQDQFASFVSDLLQLQAEVICMHFDEETIIKRSNAEFMMEPPENIQAAIQMLKDYGGAKIRVEVKAESVAQIDQGRVQAERAEFLNALSTFMQSLAPMMQGSPELTPHMLKMLQWVMSGFRGSAEIEGVMDRAIDDSLKKLQEKQGQPDPEQQKMQAQMQAQMQAIQANAQAKMQEIQAKAQADMQTRQQDLQADLQELQMQHQQRMEQLAAQHQAKMEEIQASAEAKLVLERVGMDANIAQTTQAAAVETEKDEIYEKEIKTNGA